MTLTHQRATRPTTTNASAPSPRCREAFPSQRQLPTELYSKFGTSEAPWGVGTDDGMVARRAPEMPSLSSTYVVHRRSVLFGREAGECNEVWLVACSQVVVGVAP
jgi:hypothetical protein